MNLHIIISASFCVQGTAYGCPSGLAAYGEQVAAFVHAWQHVLLNIAALQDLERVVQRYLHSCEHWHCQET